MDGTHQFNQFFFNLKIFFLNRRRNRLSGQNCLNALVLNFLQIVIITGNFGQNFQYRLQQRFFHSRNRSGSAAAHAVNIIVIAGGSASFFIIGRICRLIILFLDIVVNGIFQFNVVFQIIVNIVKVVFGGNFFGHFFQIINRSVFFVINHSFGIIAVHHFQIDDIAQLHSAFQQIVTPVGNGFNCHRAFAQTVNHNRFAGLNTFGYGNFPFPGQKFDGAHLFQIHADRVVRTA